MYPQPSESVYKIVGIRGSGKTVIFGNILRHYKTEKMKADGWLVYDISSARNQISTLISYFLLEPEIKNKLLAEKTPENLKRFSGVFLFYHHIYAVAAKLCVNPVQIGLPFSVPFTEDFLLVDPRFTIGTYAYCVVSPERPLIFFLS